MSLLLALIALVLGLVRSCRKPPVVVRPTTSLLVIRAIDVGQGDSFLVTTPSRKNLLIDAGPPEAAGAVIESLNRADVKQLDLVVATHPHADHIGGMVKVLDSFPVRLFLDSGQPYSTRTFTQMLETIKEKRIRFVTADAGQEFELDAGIRLEVLAPINPFIKRSRGSEVNANSVVLRLAFDSFSMLFTGDSEQETERRLLDTYPDLSARILKVAHHGSRYSTTVAFLDRVRPEAAIISCGSDNRYGHPAQRTLDRLRPVVHELHRTDIEGEIMISTDGASYQIVSARSAQNDLWVGREPRRNGSESQSRGAADIEEE